MIRSRSSFVLNLLSKVQKAKAFNVVVGVPISRSSSDPVACLIAGLLKRGGGPCLTWGKTEKRRAEWRRERLRIKAAAPFGFGRFLLIQTEVPAPVLPPVGGKKCFEGLKWNPLHGGESGLRRICSDTAYCLQLNLILLPFCLPEKSKRRRNKSGVDSRLWETGRHKSRWRTSGLIPSSFTWKWRKFRGKPVEMWQRDSFMGRKKG